MIPNLVALIGWVLALTGIQGSAFPEPPTTPRKATRGFLADAAHELRTPIAGIQAAAEQVAARPSSGTTPSRGASSAAQTCYKENPAARAGWSPTCWT